ncbi:hypothetical protein JNUCC23_10875 [Peribacillus sp. JNUCC 23]
MPMDKGVINSLSHLRFMAEGTEQTYTLEGKPKITAKFIRSTLNFELTFIDSNTVETYINIENAAKAINKVLLANTYWSLYNS